LLPATGNAICNTFILLPATGHAICTNSGISAFIFSCFLFPCYDFNAKTTSIDCFFTLPATTSGAIVSGHPPHPEQYHRIQSNTTFQAFIASWLIVFFFSFLMTLDATFHCNGCHTASVDCFLSLIVAQMPPPHLEHATSSGETPLHPEQCQFWELLLLPG